MSTAAPPPSAGVPLSLALRACDPLSRLLQRVDESRARFGCIEADLPDTLRLQVRPGTIDDTAWTLQVPNGAVAAKLRQLVPTIEERLRSAGWPSREIRVRVQR